jgi:uncharacterized membrane protein YphA (DoxX/SURF4 family)
MATLIGFLFLFLFFALVVAPILLCTFKRKEANLSDGWGLSTRYFLVLLRLVIGWHFLWEGLDKFKSTAWSSEAYLREASGPLAPLFRNLAGDSLVERLTPGPNNQFPEALAADWNNYFDHFRAYYSLSAEQAQMAELVLRQNMSKTLTWMTAETKLIARPLPQGPPLMVAMTVPERLQDLRKKEEQVRNIEENVRPTFGDTTFATLLDVKGQVRRARAELRADLNKQTGDMKKALAGVLSGGLKMPCAVGGGAAGALSVPPGLSTEQKQLRPMPEPAGKPIRQWSTLEWSDHIVKYGLVLVGGLLLLGLLTRTACVAGALFLLMFFLAMPPLPGWPENPRAEGHYLFINKNIIEMFALLALATTRSGRWAGLDGLIQFLSPHRHSKKSAGFNAEEPVLRRLEELPSSLKGQDTPQSFSPVSTEKTHGP